jgi:deoxyribonuclease-4
MKFGVHVSITGSIDQAIDRASDLDCDTFQIFTRSSRSWSAKALETETVSLFKEKKKKKNLSEIVVHMPYLPNLASSENETYTKSVETLLSEIERCDILDVQYLVLHLGSHKGVGFEKGQKQLIKALEKAIAKDHKVMVLLENSAGTKNSIGSEFKDIGFIMDNLSDKSNIGICFDTCHAFAAGYDLRTKSKIEKTLEEFDSLIGMAKLNLVHANDSTGFIKGGRDNHQHIGLGHIKEEGFKEILKQFPQVPYILETPLDEVRDDVGNLHKIRFLAGIKSNDLPADYKSSYEGKPRALVLEKEKKIVKKGKLI